MRGLDCLRSARNTTVVALAVTLLPTCGAAAGAMPWVVVESHGDVTQQTGDGRLAIAPGATLAEGAPIRTGADGALVVAHGNDRVTVSANSAFVLPSGVDPATGPSILETLGTLLFKVEHTPGRRFEVDTPYLAAVVKGTVFTVTVGAEQMVHVAEGAVEVTARTSHDAVLVHPGQTATLASPRGMPSVIDSASPAGKPASTSPRSDKRGDATSAPAGTARGNADGRSALRLTHTMGDQPLDVAALTNGLVKGGKDATASSTSAAAGSPGAGVGAEAAASVGTGSSLSLSASAPTEASSTAGPSVSVTVGGSPSLSVNAGTPIAGVTAAANTPVVAAVTGLVPGVVDSSPSLVHGASATAKLPGANSPAAAGRKP